jgi:hypothetical protein
MSKYFPAQSAITWMRHHTKDLVYSGAKMLSLRTPSHGTRMSMRAAIRHRAPPACAPRSCACSHGTLLAVACACAAVRPAQAQTTALAYGERRSVRAGRLYVDVRQPSGRCRRPAGQLARLKPASKVDLLGGSYWLRGTAQRQPAAALGDRSRMTR